jgi:hypothetical protein
MNALTIVAGVVALAIVIAVIISVCDDDTLMR